MRFLSIEWALVKSTEYTDENHQSMCMRQRDDVFFFQQYHNGSVLPTLEERDSTCIIFQVHFHPFNSVIYNILNKYNEVILKEQIADK